MANGPTTEFRCGVRSIPAILVALSLLLAACGGSDDDTGMISPTEPLTFREAFIQHLSDGLDDSELAADLIGRLGERTVNALDAAVQGDVEDTLLALSPPTVEARRIDSVVVFAFGNRVDADGKISSGPMNEDLAATVEAFRADHAVPVYAQWEVADLLVERGVSDVVSIGITVDENGELVYLSTAGVAAQAVELAATDGIDLGQVGVIAFADHAVRSVLTARAAGMTADVPAGVVLPSTYDPDSGQPWTRDRLNYLAIDLPTRLLFAP